jgi:DNA-binding NarL/FixJ family response regulator
MIVTKCQSLAHKGQLVWRVLIVEDDSQAREFFRASVLRCHRLQLVGCVGTVAEALAVLEQAKAAPPDVLLVDLNLPDGLGFEVIRYAARRCPSAEALVISMFGDEDNVLAAIEAGALGYIHKDATPENIAQTILDMKDGASPISPMIARRVLSQFRSRRPRPAAAGAAAAPPAASEPAEEGKVTERPALSSREQEVLELIARGFSYAEIARIKAISVHTVQTHIKGLYSKLAVHSKNEAVYEATRIGLL